jgi:RimJ/RimL family protein N-acetyltransferase
VESIAQNTQVMPDVVSSIAWPLFGLRVTTPRLSLRLPSDTELIRLAERGAGRLLSPEQAGFMSGWALLLSPEFERTFLQFHWRLRGHWSPSNWSLALGIYPSGEAEPVGGIDMSSSGFAQTRAVSSGWWLLPEWRGRGLGTEAVSAMLHLAFAGLEASQARSIVNPDNEASLAIGRGLGYSVDGTEPTVAGDGRGINAVRLVLDRAQWLPIRRSDIALSGVGECADMFGI